MRRAVFALAFAVAYLTAAMAAQDAPREVNFGATTGVIELKSLLKPFTPPASSRPDNSAWYIFTALNTSDRPATRVLHAGQPPDNGLGIVPHAQRPTILQVASTNPGVEIKPNNAYGRKGFRVTIPAFHADTAAS